MRVGILGGGRWGQALARLVLAAGHEPLIAYRDKREKPPHMLPSTDDPPRVPAECELVLVATSAAQVRNAVRLARPGPRNRVVIAGRGIEPGTGEWLSNVVAAESAALRTGALAGPAPAEEILNGGLCAGVVASRFAEVRTLVVSALHSSRYRCYDSEDLVGVELSSAFVPVLATLVGVAQNLGGAGVGLHAMVLSRGIAESSRLARALGGDPTTLAGLAGIGDLVSSQCAPGAPYWEAGKALTKGKPDAVPVDVAKALLSRAKTARVELPLTEGLVALAGGADPLVVVGKLMGREATHERG